MNAARPVPRGVTEIRARGGNGVLLKPWALPPYFRGARALFCQRQNTGRAGLDDHYSPVS